jgi:glycosyltransferase involved in cell wall biosynthesis
MQKSVDVVFDQIALPHFGATAPEALACGVPVIMSYDPASTRWIIPEPAPILTAWTPEDVVAQVKLALDPEWRVEFRKKAERWIKQYHSLDTAINLHVDVYRRLLPV